MKRINSTFNIINNMIIRDNEYFIVYTYIMQSLLRIPCGVLNVTIDVFSLIL